MSLDERMRARLPVVAIIADQLHIRQKGGFEKLDIGFSKPVPPISNGFFTDDLCFAG